MILSIDEDPLFGHSHAFPKCNHPRETGKRTAVKSTPVVAPNLATGITVPNATASWMLSPGRALMISMCISFVILSLLPVAAGSPPPAESQDGKTSEEAMKEQIRDTWIGFFDHFIRTAGPDEGLLEEPALSPKLRRIVNTKVSRGDLASQGTIIQSTTQALTEEVSKLWVWAGTYYSVLSGWIPFKQSAVEEMLYKKCMQIAETEEKTKRSGWDQIPIVGAMLVPFGEEAEEACKKLYRTCMLNGDEATNEVKQMPRYVGKLDRQSTRLLDLISEFTSFNRSQRYDKALETATRIKKGVNVTSGSVEVAIQQWHALHLWTRILKTAMVSVEYKEIKSHAEIRKALREECQKVPHCRSTKEFVAFDTRHVPGFSYMSDTLKLLKDQIQELGDFFAKVSFDKPSEPTTIRKKVKRKEANAAKSKDEL